MFKLAWRNIWRNKRRTLLTVAAIGFSILLLNTMMSMQEGTYNAMLEHATEIWNGKLRIFARGYFGHESLTRSFIPPKEVIDYLKAHPQLHWTPRIDGFALVSFKDKTYGASITGIDLEREKQVSILWKKIFKGRFLEKGDRGKAVIGVKLAKNLRVGIGDKIAVVAQGRDGSIGAKLFEIVGLLKTSILELDRMKILISIEDADEIFSMAGHITTIVLYFPTDHIKLEQVKAELQQVAGKELEIIDWKQMMPEVLEMIEFDRSSAYIFYALLVLIVAFGLLNTIYMAVFERRKEFAILRAMGMKRARILLMIILESIYIAAIGAVAGFLLSWPIVLYFVDHPIRFSGKTAELMESFLFEPAMYFKFAPWVAGVLSLLTFAVAVAMAIFPAIRAVRENLAEQLKFEK